MHVNTNRAFYQADMINFVHWGDTNHTDNMLTWQVQGDILCAKLQ